jgi:hypothetical protein
VGDIWAEHDLRMAEEACSCHRASGDGLVDSLVEVLGTPPPPSPLPCDTLERIANLVARDSASRLCGDSNGEDVVDTRVLLTRAREVAPKFAKLATEELRWRLDSILGRWL